MDRSRKPMERDHACVRRCNRAIAIRRTSSLERKGRTKERKGKAKRETERKVKECRERPFLVEANRVRETSQYIALH